jgi:hypothetical protein
MDGEQIYIFGNRQHGCEPWKGICSKLLAPIALGEFFPGELKVYVRQLDRFTVVLSLN